MKLIIIILHYGDISVTKKCIASLYSSEKQKFSLIVVNNMQQQLSASIFAKKKITVINNKKNVGFAAGVNIGIKRAVKENADFIGLVNNDAYVQKPIFKALVDECSKETNGIVGPAIIFKKSYNKTFDVGGKINKLLWRTSHKEVEKITDKTSHVVDYVSGCCMVVRKEVFKKIGLFDESFFLYYEDADFCLRAKKVGFQTVIVPQITIEHELSKSAGKMSTLAIYHLLRSAILFGRKNAKSPLQKFVNRLFIVFQAFLFLKANPASILAIAQAFLQS